MLTVRLGLWRRGGEGRRPTSFLESHDLLWGNGTAFEEEFGGFVLLITPSFDTTDGGHCVVGDILVPFPLGELLLVHVDAGGVRQQPSRC